MEIRKFVVLENGMVRCDLLCLDEKFMIDRHSASINGREHVCTALGTPTTDGGKMRGSTFISLGRVCSLAVERDGIKVET